MWVPSKLVLLIPGTIAFFRWAREETDATDRDPDRWQSSAPRTETGGAKP